jgi:hypothetical protein
MDQLLRGCRAATCAEIAELTERIDTYGPTRGDAAAQVAELYWRLNDSTVGKNLPDRFVGDVMHWSGYGALEEACRREGIVLPDE